MSQHAGFRLPRILLPRPGIDLRKWAVVACDQYTSEPDYWRQVEAEVGNAPSTLRLIFPEVHLGAADARARIGAIQQAMRRYLEDGLLVPHEGAVYVERTVGGRTRRGLMLEIDLEHYDYAARSSSLVRPTEGTIVERLAPRIEVRRDAALELPHILVLIDDAEGTVIEPLAAARGELQPLYATELMLDGGALRGWAVDAARGARAAAALAALGQPERCAQRYGVPAGTPPLLFAVGDGNHSLATAKAIWEQTKAQVGPGHPSRYALVEIENVHDAALAFEPIHRLLFDVQADLRVALRAAFGARLTLTELGSAAEMAARVAGVAAPTQAVGLVEPGPHFALAEIAAPGASLAVGSVQPVLDAFVTMGGAREIDYIHGDDTLVRLASERARAGLHFATLGKSDLFRQVVREGPLPRKAFSMGEAHEKRYYFEARRIR
ncbi:MAG: DUF1015 domain-containing protein [Proteobacteria bacterium]|nr:DUF1015 domain-containing protein [Pseudomonadota bacterium]